MVFEDGVRGREESPLAEWIRREASLLEDMMGMSEALAAHPRLEADLREIRALIAKYMESDNPVLHSGLERFAQRPGKMLRPALVLLSARMGDFNKEKMYRLAAAVELLHIATLVHDDIIDDSDVRRGVPTLHTSSGLRCAVLAGDYLFTRCFQLTADFANPESGRLLASVVGKICESEVDQARGLAISLRSYLRRIAGKTALLFMMSAAVGASESSCEAAQLPALRFAAYGMGMAFQIVDDILDIDGCSSTLGKPVGRDAARKVETLPFILAARRDGEVRRLLREGPSGGHRRIKKLRKGVLASGAVEEARKFAAVYIRQAESALQTLPPGDERAALLALANAFLHRDR